jgi:hypothetical protein
MPNLPAWRTLSGLTDRGCEGVGIESVAVGTPVTIHTLHSTYELIVRDGARHDVLLRGGRLFPEWTEARLNGSTAGGSALKSGWIGIGLRIEIVVDGKIFTTSPVQSIWIERTAAVA